MILDWKLTELLWWLALAERPRSVMRPTKARLQD